MEELTIRTFREGEEAVLRRVFLSSVHGLARSHYSEEQLDAWAPEHGAADVWTERLRRNRPFVAELDGEVVGFADLQSDGYIDQFFVAAPAAGRGVGAALMRHIEGEARGRRIERLSADVSRNAQPFFRRLGFVLEAEQTVVVSGVTLVNGRMSRQLIGDDGEGLV